MRRAIWMVSVLSVVALGGQESEGQPSSQQEAIPVTVVAVEEREIHREISISGIVKPKEEVKLSFMFGGRVEEVAFDEGDWVGQDAVLARLDQTEIRARVTHAKIGFDKAKRDLERVRKLYKEDAVTLQQFQDATSAFEKAQADLVIARHNLTHSEIRAPFSGRIAFKFIQEWELIPLGTPAFVLVDLREVKVEVGVSDSDMGEIRHGDEGEIRVDSYRSEKFLGSVTRKAIAADPTSGTFKVEIAVENREERLLPGMIAQVKIHTRTHQGMFLPMAALSNSSEGKGILFLVDETMDRVHSKEVVIGAVLGDKVEVLEGIGWKDKVVVGGSAYLKDGDWVRIVE